MGSMAIGPGPSADRRTDLHPLDFDFQEARNRAGFLPQPERLEARLSPQEMRKELFRLMQQENLEEDDENRQ